MTLLIPAVWYRALAIIERRWGWSPVEEAVLLALRENPGTSASVAAELGIPRQVAEATVSRLMRFGLIEVRIAPEPALAMTHAARAHLLAGRSLPERAQRREMAVSLVFDKVGGSVFRRREVVIKPIKKIPQGATIVNFPEDDEAETDSSMEDRVRHLLSSSLRPGEFLAMVRSNHSLFEKRFIHLDLDRAREGALPEGANDVLRAAVREHLASGRLPAARPSQPARPTCLDKTIETTFSPQQILFGGGDHLARLEEIVDAARSDVFVLSTFVASQDDAKARHGQDRVWAALERAVRRGVRVHLFSVLLWTKSASTRARWQSYKPGCAWLARASQPISNRCTATQRSSSPMTVPMVPVPWWGPATGSNRRSAPMSSQSNCATAQSPTA